MSQGNPPRGNDRRVCPISDEEKKRKAREASRRFRENHPEGTAERNRKFREANPNYGKEWYRKNRDRVLARNIAHQKKNRERYAGYTAEWRKRKKATYFRDNHLIKKYGITFDELQGMLVAQAYKCAICEKSIDEVTRNVDHDHETGAIRGLLCRTCNMALGLFSESLSVLRKATSYLETYEPKEATIAKKANVE